MPSAARRALGNLRYRRATVVGALACAVGSALVWGAILVLLVPLSAVVFGPSDSGSAADSATLARTEPDREQPSRQEAAPDKGDRAPAARDQDQPRPAPSAPVRVGAVRSRPYTQHWTVSVLPWVRGSSPWLGSDLGALAGLLAVLIALSTVHLVLRYMHECLGVSAVAGGTTALRRAVLRHSYQLGMWLFRRTGTAEVTERFTADVQATEAGVRAALVEAVRRGLTALVSVVVALAIDPLLALLFLVLAVFVGYMARLMRRPLRRRTRQAIEQSANRLAILQDMLLGMRLVKSYTMERFQQERFNEHVGRHQRDMMRAARIEALDAPVLMLLAVVALSMFVGLAGYNVVARRLPLEASVSLCAALSGFGLSTMLLLGLRKAFKRMRRRAHLVYRFLGAEPEVAEVSGAKFLSPMSRRLRFDHVTLRSESGEGILRDLCFTVEAGWQVAITGTNPEEKRALLNLIPRFVDPTNGTVGIDDEDIRWVTLESLRAQIGLVPQGGVLLNDTVRNNIGCGDTSYSLSRIADAAKMAHAHNFIQNLPQGYETMVGEHGVPLSPGQQHRIGLARAILRNPAIVIVEEPVEPFDAESQGLIDDAMKRFMPGRTLICVAHRLATIRQATRVLCLHQGRLEGLASHRELTNTSELYRHLHYMEFNVFAAGSVGS